MWSIRMLYSLINFMKRVRKPNYWMDLECHDYRLDILLIVTFF